MRRSRKTLRKGNARGQGTAKGNRAVVQKIAADAGLPQRSAPPEGAVGQRIVDESNDHEAEIAAGAAPREAKAVAVVEGRTAGAAGRDQSRGRRFAAEA